MIGYMVSNYQIVEKIGDGGMGEVFKGIDMMLEREVAIKMLRPELARQPDVVERFRTEAITLAKLNHPNIATLYNFLRQVNDFFMVMEFVPGRTLDELIRHFGATPVEYAVPLFCQPLDGIDHAHRMGIIHRDIKPANMMLTDSGSIKVMDFGIARVLGSARMTRQGNVVGTIEYMSPEAVRGLEVDARSDVYSLGILLYEILTGRVPFSSTSDFEMMKMQVEQAPQPPRTFTANIPIEIEQAIMRALAKKPEVRFQTAGEFRDRLLAALGATGNLSGRLPSMQSVSGSDGAASSSSPPSNAIKESQLGPSDEHPTTLSFGAPNQPLMTSPQLPPTRLGQAMPAMYAPVVAPVGELRAEPPGRPPVFLNKFNGKHYLVAILALLILASLPFTIIGLWTKLQSPSISLKNGQESQSNVVPQGASPSPASEKTLPAASPIESTGENANKPPEAPSNSVTVPRHATSVRTRVKRSKSPAVRPSPRPRASTRGRRTPESWSKKNGKKGTLRLNRYSSQSRGAKSPVTSKHRKKGRKLLMVRDHFLDPQH